VGVILVSDESDLVRDIEALEERIAALEETSDSQSLDTGNESPTRIMKRLNAVQALVDQIEIEIDKLEMRVSAIEHVGFRLRTSGQ
jgi:hypothetical protein